MKISLPIQITFLRILLTPIIILCAIYSHWYEATFLFIIAICTDFFDGFIARKYHQESHFGQLLDPIADKILIISLMYTLFVFKNFNNFSPLTYLLGLFFILKEIIFLSGAAILYVFYNKFFKPTLFSRIVSVLEMIIILNTLISKNFTKNIYEFNISNSYFLISKILIILAIVLSILLLLQYIFKIYLFLIKTDK